MKSLVIFYILISAPLAAIVLLARNNALIRSEFTLLLLFYAVIYHPLVSGIRLILNQKIERSDFWKTFIPGWNLKYFTFLFFTAQNK
jgi:hypothetical protein